MLTGLDGMVNFILTAFSVTVTPHLSSVSNSGMVFGTYWNYPITQDMQEDDVFGLGQGDLANTPFF